MISAAARVGSVAWLASAFTASTGFFCASRRDSTSYVFGIAQRAAPAIRIMLPATNMKNPKRRRTDPSEKITYWRIFAQSNRSSGAGSWTGAGGCPETGRG